MLNISEPYLGFVQKNFSPLNSWANPSSIWQRVGSVFTSLDQPEGKTSVMAWKWTKIIGLGFLGTAAILALSGMAYQTICTKLDKRRYPPIGKMVDIGGYSLHINYQGNKGPTVVLDSGQGCNSLDWALVQPSLAEFTRVCSYDRAGYGWSDESPKERSAGNMVDELHSLLHKADIPAPYILVGHSLGGVNVRLYASRYPDEVAGVVLVDSSHEDQLDKMPKMDLPSGTSLLWMSRLGISRLFSNNAKRKELLKNVYGDLPEETQKIRNALGESTTSLKTALGEAFALPKSLLELKSSGGMLNDKPLIVITACKTMSAEGTGISKEQMDDIYSIFQDLQKDLVTKSTNSKHVFAEKSDHMIPYNQPEIIVDSVQNIIKELEG